MSLQFETVSKMNCMVHFHDTSIKEFFYGISYANKPYPAFISPNLFLFILTERKGECWC